MGAKHNFYQLAYAAAYMILCRPQGTYVLSLLQELHWLFICFQVQSKVLAVTYKALHGLGPGYFEGPSFSSHIHQSEEAGKVMGPVS